MKLKQVVVAAVAGVGLLSAGFWLGGAVASTADPGSAADPLVSKSYLDAAIARLKQEIGQGTGSAPGGGANAGSITQADLDRALAQVATKAELSTLATKTELNNFARKTDLAPYATKGEIAGLASTSYVNSLLAFQVVEVPVGGRIIGEAGTEIVVRGGRATAIGSANGGLLDATGGIDVPHGEAVRPNHLLVVPRTDGRGLTATAHAILMVKGAYRVEAAQ